MEYICHEAAEFILGTGDSNSARWTLSTHLGVKLSLRICLRNYERDRFLAICSINTAGDLLDTQKAQIITDLK